MKLAPTKSINLYLLPALLVTGLSLAVTAIGCGDDNKESPVDAAADVTMDTGAPDTGIDAATAQPKTAAECKSYIATNDPKNVGPRTDCLCEKCLDVFAPCMVNLHCVGILACGLETGCRGLACASDPKCSLLISADYTAALLANPVSTCNDTNKCAVAAQTDQ